MPSKARDAIIIHSHREVIPCDEVAVIIELTRGIYELIYRILRIRSKLYIYIYTVSVKSISGNVKMIYNI